MRKKKKEEGEEDRMKEIEGEVPRHLVVVVVGAQ